MPSLEEIDLDLPYQTGDPWGAEDASLLGLASFDLFDTLRSRHAAADGAHKDPRVPVAAALVTVAGAVYTIRKNYRMPTLTRVSAGLVKLDLSGVTLIANRWGAEVGPGPNDAEHAGTFVDPTTTATVSVQLVDGVGAAADVSFLVLVYGETA